ncbi:MAG TPA: efflux RND transporter periplasmic adaptor subunit, partial [Candidatus Polarisedimenticolia bacterium]|nr:efflux RND transporter periplasmic adaptor subunit [Candidatus Polarisedimenticolia bacterium]
MRGFRVATLLAAVLTMSCRSHETPPPEHEDAAAASREEVVLSEEAVAAAGITLVEVSSEEFHPHVVATGVIRPDAQRSVSVRARLAGLVARVQVDVGEQVGQGQALAFIEGPDLTAALARHRTAA